MRSAQKRGSSSHGKEDAYTSDFDDESMHGQGSNSKGRACKDMNSSSVHSSLDISSSSYTGGGGSRHGGSSSLGTPFWWTQCRSKYIAILKKLSDSGLITGF